MPSELTPDDRDLINSRNRAHLATLNADGSPQVSPVWVDVRGDVIRVNSARGRIKERNVLKDPRVALSITADDDPLRRVMVQGEVVRITEDDAVEHIHELSRRYDGRDYANLTPEMTRIIIEIRPLRVARAG